MNDRPSVADAARQAEDLGYEEFYSYDHIGEVDPFVPLMVAAEATETLRVGPLVLNNELHHPVLLARTAATVDLMTDGRLVLGIGTGYARDEHDSAGIELRPPGSRVDRLDESLGLLRSLLDTGAGSADGHHRVAIDDLGVRPVQDHVPLLIGGHGRRVVGLAARHADIYQFTGLEHGPDGSTSPSGFGMDDVRARSRWIHADAGDRYGEIELSVLVQRSDVGDDAHVAAAAAAERFDDDRTLVDETPFLMFGSVGQVVEKLERLRDEIDVSHVVVRDASGFSPVVAELAGR